MHELTDYLVLLPHLATPSAVGAEFSRRCAAFGLGTYAIGAIPAPGDMAPPAFLVQNWPKEWGIAYEERGFAQHDPTPRAAMMRSDPITLSEMRAGKAGFVLTPEALEVLDFGASLGRGEGLIVPIHGPQGYRGIVCMVGEGPDPSPANRAILHLWALYTHNRLRELFAAQEAETQETLSAREIAVLRLARTGLVDAEIAASLGITIRTVRFHLENARHKLRSRTRSEAIATAITQHLLGP